MHNRESLHLGENSSNWFVELACRLGSGERDVAASILASMPGVDAEFAIDLIYREYLVLGQFGRAPAIPEYCDRYPEHAVRLQRLLEVDGEFEGLQSSMAEQTMGANDFLDDTIEECPVDAGRVFGRYELLHPIGHGGSSRVFKARQIGLDRIVAVKLLSSNLFDQQLERRFRKEAELIARLQHSDIVQLFDYGCVDGQFFIVLEFVDGGSLDQRSEGAIPVDQLARLMIRLARAIQFAHEQNIIHRDLKPSNILLTRAGEPRIADFGLARSMEVSASRCDTNTGATIGTPSFMAPEQISADSQSIGPAVDVYGLGAILYHLITTRPPFVGENLLDTLRLVRETAPVPPSALRAKLPRDLEVICLRCLHKDPARRFASAAELVDELQRFVDGVPILSRPASRIEKSVRWCRRRPLVAGLYVALAIAIASGFSGILWQWKQAKANAAVAEARQQESQQNFEQARAAIDKLTELSRELSTIPETDEIRKQLLNEVLAFYLNHVGATNDAQSAFEAANTLVRIAEIRGELQNYQQAIDDLTQAKAILSELARTFPKRIAFKKQLASGWFKSGIYLRCLSRSEEAADCHMTAADLFLECWRLSGDREFLVNRAGALNNACGAWLQAGKLDRGAELNAQALELFETLRELDNENATTEFLIDRAIVFEAKADLLVRHNELEAAAANYDRALDDLERVSEKGLEKPVAEEYLPRTCVKAARTHLLLGSEPAIWSRHSDRALEICRRRWESRPDRPALGSYLVYASWSWAKSLWFAEQHDESARIYLEMIETLADIKNRFPNYREGADRDLDIASHRLCLLWAICPVDELRDPAAALELSRTKLNDQPDCLHARTASVIVEALGGDSDVAEMLLGRPSTISNSHSPETLERLVRLAIQHRRGVHKLTESDLDFLRQARNDPQNYAGFSNQLAERILGLIANGERK